MTLRQIHAMLEIREIQENNELILRAELAGREIKGAKRKQVPREYEEDNEEFDQQMARWARESAKRKVEELRKKRLKQKRKSK